MTEMPPPPIQQNISFGAGFGVRALARIIDVVYGFVIGLVGGVFGAIILAILQQTGMIATGWQHRIQGLTVASFGLSLLGAFLYHALSEGIYGASVGKLICQLRVVSTQAQPCALVPACRRSLAYYFDALFFGLVGYSSMQKSPLNQRYGDVWAQTIVAKAKDLPASSGRPIIQFFLGCGLGSVCWIAMIALGVILKAT
jgi:uncharacterized RDD family membrane protein YckC